MPMMNRRTFSALIAGSVAAPKLSWAQASRGKVALYSGVGSDLTHYDVYSDAAILIKRTTVKLPGPIQYAWPHPSKKFLYVTSSTGGPGETGDQHHVTAFQMERGT